MSAPRHLVVMRHGESQASRKGVFASVTDSELTSVGREAAAAWTATFGGLGGLHSPLQRAEETALAAGLSSFSCSDLVEWQLGDLEGTHADTYRTAHPGWSLFVDGPPGGEAPSEVACRADRVLRTVADLGGEAQVLVGHGQFSKVLATRLLDLPVAAAAKLAFGPARCAVFSWRESVAGYALTGWNRTPVPFAELVGNNT